MSRSTKAVALCVITASMAISPAAFAQTSGQLGAGMLGQGTAPESLRGSDVPLAETPSEQRRVLDKLAPSRRATDGRSVYHSERAPARDSVRERIGSPSMPSLSDPSRD